MPRRLSAPHAAAYIGAVKVLDLYEIEYEIGQGFIAGKAFEDNWDADEPDTGNWSGTAKRYQRTTATQFASALASQINLGVSANPIRLKIYEAPNVLVFEGDCWLERASSSRKKGSLVDNSLTIRGYGDPVFIA